MDAINFSSSIQNRFDQIQRKSEVKKPKTVKNSVNSFGQIFMKSLDEVNSAHKIADKMMSDLATGKNVDIHQTMIAVEKADISFRLMLQVRNKLVAAYQEINRMQV